MRSTKRLVRADGSEEWLPAKCDGVDVKQGDTLYFNTWGGGGWGDPTDRDSALVLADVNRGVVSIDGAQRYGVVIDGKGNVDAKATEKLRDKIRAERGETGLFSFGGTIDEIKARSLEETHLPPPETPVFSS
jgi:N-methylhydantoinase B